MLPDANLILWLYHVTLLLSDLSGIQKVSGAIQSDHIGFMTITFIGLTSDGEEHPLW